jgi:hypothetical protein
VGFNLRPHCVASERPPLWPITKEVKCSRRSKQIEAQGALTIAGSLLRYNSTLGAAHP